MFYLDRRIDGLPESENIHHNVAAGWPGDRTFRGPRDRRTEPGPDRHWADQRPDHQKPGVLRPAPQHPARKSPVCSSPAIRAPYASQLIGTNRKVDIARGTLRTNAVHMPKH